ncbi:MAG: hypothetical protein JNM29_09285 [Candidatus Odyssella sp.]|nr:hypothetical protein [Candidatus Odyssella sp.]
MSAAAQGYSPPTNGLVVGYHSWRGDGRDGSKRTRLADFSVYLRSIEEDHILLHEQVGEELTGTVTSWRGLLDLQRWADDDQVRLLGDLEPARELWPLAAGNTAAIKLAELVQKFSVGDGKWSPTGRHFTVRFRVAGEEAITVPAGKFRAWLIVREDFVASADRAPRRIAESRCWFVPSLGWCVRSERREANGAANSPLVREAAQIIR